MFCNFGIFLFLGIALSLTGVKILLAVMNWELKDSWTASYGINPDQPTSPLTLSWVFVSPFWILFVAPLTLKSNWSRILDKKTYHLVMEARNKIWSQGMIRHSYVCQEEYAHSRGRKWMISMLSMSSRLGFTGDGSSQSQKWSVLWSFENRNPVDFLSLSPSLPKFSI